MAEGVPTNNQMGRGTGPCRLWGGLDITRHIVPTAFLVRVQCFRKGLYKVVEGPSTRPIVLSMINGSYYRRRRRLTIFRPDEMKSLCLWPSLLFKLDHGRRPGERFLLTNILGTKFHQISTEVRSMILRTFQMYFEACDIYYPVSAALK